MFKEHKKLYKAGKNWLTMTLSIAAASILIGATNALADETSTTSTPTTSQVSSMTTQTTSTQSAENQQSVKAVQNTQPSVNTTTTDTENNQSGSNGANDANGLTVSQSKASTWDQWLDFDNDWFSNDEQNSTGNQWTHFNNGWSYTDEQGNWVYNQWRRINNSWYYFNNNGYAQTGWYRSGAGNWYYFDPVNAWAYTGWQRINNNWYHFDENNAWANTGWYRSGAGNWYYFDPVNAWADTGWQNINGHWYYFDPTNAWADRGWFRSGAGNWYYFDWNNAWALTGWQKINGNWYYFDWNNAWALTGWQRLGNTWYYFDPTNAWMETGWQTIGNRSYYFEPSGAWNANKATGSWLKDADGNWEYQLPDGKLAAGWQQIGNDWYYFAAGWQRSINGWRYFADDVMQSDSIVSGKQVEGVNTPGPGTGNYYLGKDGRLVKNSWINLDGDWYYADGSHNGRLVKKDHGEKTTDSLKVPQDYINVWKEYAQTVSGESLTAKSNYDLWHRNKIASAQAKKLNQDFVASAADKATPLTLNHDGTLSRKDVIIATQYAAELINPIRKAIGVNPYQITNASIDIAMENCKEYHARGYNEWKDSHKGALMKQIAHEWGTDELSESMASNSLYSEMKTVADLKCGVHDAVVLLLFEGSDSNPSDTFSNGHTTDLLGVRYAKENALAKAHNIHGSIILGGSDLLGVTFGNTTFRFNSIADGKSERIQQEQGYGIRAGSANDKTIQGTNYDHIVVPTPE